MSQFDLSCSLLYKLLDILVFFCQLRKILCFSHSVFTALYIILCICPVDMCTFPHCSQSICPSVIWSIISENRVAASYATLLLEDWIFCC